MKGPELLAIASEHTLGSRIVPVDRCAAGNLYDYLPCRFFIFFWATLYASSRMYQRNVGSVGLSQWWFRFVLQRFTRRIRLGSLKLCLCEVSLSIFPRSSYGFEFFHDSVETRSFDSRRMMNGIITIHKGISRLLLSVLHSNITILWNCTNNFI